MNFERRMKKHIDSTLESYTPNPYPRKRHLPLWAKITIPIAAVATAVAVAVPIINSTSGIGGFINRLRGTYVDMDKVSAFCIWSAPDKENARPKLKSFAKIKDNFKLNSAYEDDESSSPSINSDSWTEEQKEQYEWELDYDWDPEKASVLISMSDDGSVKEVVYERTNGRGQVRQDTLANAAAVFTTKNFTYVMYVDDAEWEFWKDVNYAQEIVCPNGFHCHHEEMQTIVIHNQTGKVFALKDLMKQVDKYSCGKNYTMQVMPTKDDFALVDPMYGNLIPQCYDVIFDEEEGLNYRYIIPEEAGIIDSFNWHHTIADVRRDKYGQIFVLVNEGVDFNYRGEKEIVSYKNHEVIDNTLIFERENEILCGTDKRMYAFDDGVLKVFGENFELTPVEKDLTVSFEGINGAMIEGNHIENDTGIVYHLEDNYLYSIFGDVYKVSDDGFYTRQDSLKGVSLPKYADEGFLLNGAIVAFVEAKNGLSPYYSTEGKVVQLYFGLEDGEPSVKSRTIMENATTYFVLHQRMSMDFGYKQYLLTVDNGEARAEYVVDRSGGRASLVKPITEPLRL